MYSCKVVSNEKLVVKVSLELPDYVYTIVKHYHFTICYSKKIISAIACPDALFWLPQKAKNVKFSGASPLNPIGVLTAPPPPSCYKLATLPTGAPLAVLTLLTFEIRQVILCIRQSLCGRPEPLRYNWKWIHAHFVCDRVYSAKGERPHTLTALIQDMYSMICDQRIRVNWKRNTKLQHIVH